jgi:hypothetical protein
VIAHGGVAGAVVEALVALAVLGVLAAVWLRERRGRTRRRGPAKLRDEDGRRRP